MPWPQDSGTVDVSMQGGSYVTTNDHALWHRVGGTELNALATTLGTTGGTNIFKNITSAGQFAPVVDTGGTFKQVYTGTINLGAGTISGQIQNNGTIANGLYGTATYQGGTANSINLGTPSIDQITGRNSGTAINFAKSISPAVGTWTDVAGGTFTPDAYASQIYYSVQGTAAGNRTIATPTNPSAYQQLTLAWKTSGSANGTLVWGTAFRISQDIGTPSLGTGIGWNYYNWRYNSIDSKWDFLGQILNLV